MEHSKQKHFSLAWTAAAWVVCMALLASGGLFALRLWHERAVHQAAALAVGERGQWLAMSLALRAAGAAEGGEAEAWREFSGLLRAVREVENDLEFVAVRRGEVTLFQEHAENLGEASDSGDYHFDGGVVMGRQVLTTGADILPVVTFSVTVTNPNGEPVALELGLRRGAVEWEEWPARRALDSFYRLSWATIAVCFAVCLALLAMVVRREERRERARRQEEHLAFSGVLANGIVHDFRNPMSSLRLDAQMLEKEAAREAAARPERMVELARRMRHTLDRMDKVFQEFLSLARPATATPEWLDLAQCAQECAAMLTPRFETAGTEWTLQNSASPLPIRVAGASVKRAIVNVLLNATQHAGAGGKVVVKLSRIGDRARLEVCDTGLGIPKADRERVFEMFYTTRPQGTGLGLFLARTAIEQNGGTLVAAEPDGGGACLRLEFPLAVKGAS